MTAALTLVALGAQAGKNGACAGVLATTARGDDCALTGALSGDLIAAVSAEEYAGAAACGAYLDVTGPGGTIRVQVVDECPWCLPGELDLSRTAFALVSGGATGVVRVGYRRVRNPAISRPVAFRLKKGSSSRWMAIQVVDHGNPLQRLEILRAGRWQPLWRDSDNYWIADHGIGPGPYTVRITDVYGQRLVAAGIRLRPVGLQRTTHHLYGPARSSPVPRGHATGAGNAASGHPGSGAPGGAGTAPRAPSGGPAGTPTGAAHPDGPRPPANGGSTAGPGSGGAGKTGAETDGTGAIRSGGDHTVGRETGSDHTGRTPAGGHHTGGARVWGDHTAPAPDWVPFAALPSARPFFC